MKYILLVTLTAIIGGCANTPDVKVAYYKTKTNYTVDVFKTLACDLENELVIVNSVIYTPTYYADKSKTEFINLKDIDGVFADTTMNINLTPDGRLKSINTSSTGKGSSIVKSIFSIVDTLLPGTDILSIVTPTPQPIEACEYIEKRAGKGKAMTLNYKATISEFEATSSQLIEPSSESAIHHAFLSKYIGVPTYSISSSNDFKECQITINGEEDKCSFNVQQNFSKSDSKLYSEITAKCDALIHEEEKLACLNDSLSIINESPSQLNDYSAYVKARRPGYINIDVEYCDNNKNPALCSHSKTLLPVSQLGTEFQIPIPKAAVFGGQTFAMTLDDNGGLANIQYTKANGLGDALGGANNLIDALKGPSTSDQINEAKERADWIFHQQRLAVCQANPAECPK